MAMSFINTLKDIAAKAQALCSLIGPPRHSKPLPPPITIPTLNLPFPVDLLETVDHLPLPREKRDALKLKITENVTASRQVFNTAFERACRKLSVLPDAPEVVHKYGQVYEAIYNRDHIQRIRTIFHDIIKLSSDNGARQSNLKPTFNFKSVPLLEKYFKVNAYPTLEQRRQLARETTMTMRQIEVWFQNHRNRAKKEGLPLNRQPRTQRSDPLDLTLDTSALTSTSPSTPTLLNAHSNIDVFRTSPPPHAYPTPFNPHRQPPSTPLLPLVWPRRPTVSPRPQVDISVEELTHLFSKKLTLTDDAPRRKRQPRTISQSRHSSRHTLPPSAPHPALVRFPSKAPTTTMPPSLYPQPRFAETSLPRPSAPLTHRAPRASSPRAPPAFTKSTLPSRTPSLTSVSSADSDVELALLSTPPTHPESFSDTLAWSLGEYDFNLETFLDSALLESFNLLQQPISDANLDLAFNNLDYADVEPAPQPCEFIFPSNLPALNLQFLPC